MDRQNLETMIDALYESSEMMGYLEGRGLTIDTIVEAQLGYLGPEVPSRFRHSLAIPYFDARGELVTVRHRHFRAEVPMKYQTVKGGGVHLYNVTGTNEPVVVICEGEIDSLIVRQLGIAAVAIPGTSSWRKEWRWLFRNTDLVYVLMDKDDSGVKAAARIAAQVGDLTDVELVELPDGMDANDLYLKDPEELRRLLS